MNFDLLADEDFSDNTKTVSVFNFDKLSLVVGNNVPNGIYFHNPFVIENEILHYLKSPDIHKASGLDGLSNLTLKLCPDTIIPYITF